MTAGAFDDVSLEWDGKTYVIPSSSVMPAICRVERIVTAAELHHMAATRNVVPLATVACGYGELLRFAGAEVTDTAIYRGMFKRGDKQAAGIAAVRALLALMMPPPEAITAADRAAGKTKPAAAKSSRTRSGPRPAGG